MYVVPTMMMMADLYLFVYFSRPKKTLNSKKYGVDLICYTHAVNTALHGSTKVDGKMVLKLNNRVFT